MQVKFDKPGSDNTCVLLHRLHRCTHFSTIDSLLSTLYPLLSTVSSLLSTLPSLLSTQSSICIHIYSLPTTFSSLLSTLYASLSSLYSLLLTLLCQASLGWTTEQTDLMYTQFAIQDSSLFGPNPWKILAPPSNYLSNKGFWATQPLEQVL